LKVDIHVKNDHVHTYRLLDVIVQRKNQKNNLHLHFKILQWEFGFSQQHLPLCAVYLHLSDEKDTVVL